MFNIITLKITGWAELVIKIYLYTIITSLDVGNKFAETDGEIKTEDDKDYFSSMKFDVTKPDINQKTSIYFNTHDSRGIAQSKLRKYLLIIFSKLT